MLYEKSKTGSLTPDEFAHPGKEYRGAPFWALNCRLDKETADFQIKVFDEMGMGGYNLHPRTGLSTPYMGEEYMDFIRHAVAEGKKRGMYSWLYDEDRYPSGAAGGMVTEDLRFRARCLLLTQERQENFCSCRREFDQRIAAGEKPAGYYLTSYEIILENGYLKSYRRVLKGSVSEEGQIRDAYVRLAAESPWYNDQTYVDTMNRQATKRFIELTHEKYYAALGDDFGTWIPAIFTDEPQVSGKYALTFADSAEDATISYTDDMDETYRERYGVSLLDILPEILWELPNGTVSVHRYHYHDHVAERFASAFSDTLSEWCKAHGIALTGHFMSERTLYSQTLALGEAMRCYRNMQIPGMDNLTDAKEFTTAKQAVSVARQKGRDGVLSEIYGATHWDFDFIGHKLQGDWQAALGVTVRVHHLAFLSMAGEAKRDWPASISFQSPWYQKYSYIEDHFARVNTALTRGKALSRLGVIHPIESFWISYGPCDQTQALRDRLDERFVNLADWLLYGLVDFDYISESMFPELCGKADFPIRAGEMRYEAILVPSLRTIRSTTLERLEDFAAQGGKVIFAGEIPKLVDAVPSDRAQKFAERCTVVEYDRYSVLEALQDIRDVEVRRPDGHLAEELVYQMRSEGENRWLFLCHVNRKENLADRAQEYRVSIRGSWAAELYDTLQGTIRAVKCAQENGQTRLIWKAYGQDSLLLHLSPEAAPMKSREKLPAICLAPDMEEQPFAVIHTPKRTYFSEQNVLLIDSAEYSLNGEEFSCPMPILEIDNELRARLGYPRRQDAYTQPWRVPDQTEIGDRAVLRCRFLSEQSFSGVYLAAENPEAMEISLNGIRTDHTPDGWYVDPCIQKVPLPDIRRGENLLEVSLPFGRKTDLEWMYLLGDFQVELRGTYAALRTPYEIRFGDLTRQGMPFYTGNTIYEIAFEAPQTARYVLEVPQHAAAALAVSADGGEEKTFCFAPYRALLGELKKGYHTIKITAYGNRFNGFGTLHNADSGYRWYGPDSYRTYRSQWTDSYLVKPLGILSSIYLYREK